LIRAKHPEPGCVPAAILELGDRRLVLCQGKRGLDIMVVAEAVPRRSPALPGGRQGRGTAL